VRWGHDGKELFYLGPNNELTVVPVRLDAALDAIEVGSPKTLFTARLPTDRGGWQYDVSLDGKRFLVDSLEDVTIPITVLLNWKAAQ